MVIVNYGPRLGRLCANLNRSGMQKEAAQDECSVTAVVPCAAAFPDTYDTAGCEYRWGRYRGQQDLSPEQLTSFRSEAARLRRGYRLTPCSPSPSLVSSRTERSAASRSTLLEWRSWVDVSRPPGEVDVVGQEPLLPFGHPSPPRPEPRDRSGGAPAAAPGPVCPSGIDAVDSATARPPDCGWYRAPGRRGNLVATSGVISLVNDGGPAGCGSPSGGSASSNANNAPGESFHSPPASRC